MSKFKIGVTYHGRFIGDSQLTFNYKVSGRTDCYLDIIGKDNKETRHKIKIDMNGAEYVRPFGIYSMSPQLSAKNKGLNHD